MIEPNQHRGYQFIEDEKEQTLPIEQKLTQEPTHEVPPLEQGNRD